MYYEHSLLVSAPDSWSKGCEFESRQEWRKTFLPQSPFCVQTLIRCPFHPRVTTVARKRPRSFGPKCRWQVTSKHAYTFDPTKSGWDDYAVVQAYCGNLSRNEFTRNSSGNTRSQSSQLAKPLWTDPGLKSGMSVRELISTLKKKKEKKKRRRELNCWTFAQSPRHAGKKPPPPKTSSQHAQISCFYFSLILYQIAVCSLLSKRDLNRKVVHSLVVFR